MQNVPVNENHPRPGLAHGFHGERMGKDGDIVK
jgi:hypothetical protein